MERASIPAVIAIACILATTGCGSSGDDQNTDDARVTTTTEAEAAGTEAAEQAVATAMEQLLTGRWGELYDSLHPAQQALFTRDRFVACLSQSDPYRPDDVSVVVAGSEPQTVPVPGTGEEAEAIAVTVELTTSNGPGSRGQSRTEHATEIDGVWRIINPFPLDQMSC